MVSSLPKEQEKTGAHDIDEEVSIFVAEKIYRLMRAMMSKEVGRRKVVSYEHIGLRLSFLD